MNGVLTEREARHLTPLEYERYFTAGLCPPPSMEMMGLLRESDRVEIRRLEEQLDSLNDELIEIRNEKERLNRDLLFAVERIVQLEKASKATTGESTATQTGL